MLATLRNDKDRMIGLIASKFVISDSPVDGESVLRIYESNREFSPWTTLWLPGTHYKVETF